MTASENVLAQLADGDADAAIAALIDAQRAGVRFTFTPHLGGLTVRAVTP